MFFAVSRGLSFRVWGVLGLRVSIFGLRGGV